MGYVNYKYYKSIYSEDSMPETDFNRLLWKAEKYLDKFTLNKLKFAFPTEKSAIKDVHMCMIEVITKLYQVDQYQKSVMEGIGYAKESDGTLKGKVITSISSGSESMGFSAGGNSVNTEIGELAKDSRKLESSIYLIIRNFLDFTQDSNGIFLTNRVLPYPVKNAPISRPPENEPVKKSTEPEESKNTDEKIYSELNAQNTNFGVGYNDSVVIYNFYHNSTSGNDQYYGTRIDGVKLEFTEEKNQNKSGSEDVSVCILSIKNDNTLPKPYIDSKSWAKLVGDEMLNYFTLNTDGDFFVLVKRDYLNLDVKSPVGLVNGGLSPYTEEGGVLDYMKENYGYVYDLSSFASFKGLPRFEVGGK